MRSGMAHVRDHTVLPATHVYPRMERTMLRPAFTM